MNTRPRCRDWEPLLTNQLRLRNLIQIKAFNVECHPKSQLYFTLHLTSMSSPFYTSERIEPQSNFVEWPEIMCEQILTSASRSVCVRIWQHYNLSSNNNSRNGFSNNSNNCSSKNDLTAMEPKRVDCDKILFMWGVYFSGLIQIPKHCDIRLCKNTLIFLMNGGSFTSANYIEDESESENNNQDTSTNSIPNENLQNSDCDSTSSKSLENNYSSISSSLNYTRELENANNQITQILNESRYFKVRYVELDFYNTELRPSYTVDKLLKLQEIQRIMKRRVNDSKILRDRICMKSAYCLNLELISNKAIFYEAPKRTTMGRTLDRILAETQFKPKPEDLLKAQDLRRKIEVIKSRLRLLYHERDRYKQRNRKLAEFREQLKDEASLTESKTVHRRYELRKENDKLYQDRLTIAGQKEMLVNIKSALMETRKTLLMELNDIYCVRKNENELFTINGIYLPDAESYTDSTPHEDISVALGFVAHAVIICSKIMNIPMRNFIKHEGSRSKIIDNIKELPPNDRIFPLFCRSSPPNNVLLYGVFLLNQNISQLKFLLGISRGDLRATLANLFDILNGFEIEKTTRKIVDNIKPSVETSQSSSLEISMTVPLTSPVDIETVHQIRKSTSLDSFENKFFALKKNQSRYNSDPTLYGRSHDKKHTK